MTGMAASAGMFVRGSYAFLRDFSSAYHNVPLGTQCNHQCARCHPCRGALDPHNSATHSAATKMGQPLPDPATKLFKPTDGGPDGWSQTEGPMAGAPRCGYQGYKNPSMVPDPPVQCRCGSGDLTTPITIFARKILVD